MPAQTGGSTRKILSNKRLLQDIFRAAWSFSEAVIAAAPPDAPPLSAEQREALKRDDPNHDPKALAAQSLGNSELIVHDETLKANKVPTLVIYGGNDHPERFTDLKKALSNAEYKVIAGAGHAGAVQSREFVKDIAHFFKSINSVTLTNPSEVDVKLHGIDTFTANVHRERR